MPHVARTAATTEAYVWALDAERAPAYWFPRDCPRALAWERATTTRADAALLGCGAPARVHAIEYGWLDAMRTVELFAYRLDARAFRPLSPLDPYALVATEPVVPLGAPERVGDLLGLHDEAGIELRVLDCLWPFFDAVSASTLGFSGIRLANARPRRGPSVPRRDFTEC